MKAYLAFPAVFILRLVVALIVPTLIVLVVAFTLVLRLLLIVALAALTAALLIVPGLLKAGAIGLEIINKNY